MLLTICVVLAFLLFAGVLSGSASGWVFAVSLVVLGGLSHGFRRR